MPAMVGALINSAGIVLGGVLTVARKKTFTDATQSRLKLVLGVFTVAFGLRLTCYSLNGSLGQRLRLLGIVLVSMTLGKLVGKILGLQTFSNSIGRFATTKLAAAGTKPQLNEGFQVATALFCAAPLAIFGSVQEGLTVTGFSQVFIIKAIMDGLATMAFSVTFGWGVMLSAIPVLAWQCAIIRGVAWLEPALGRHPQPLLDALNATDGLLIFCVALIILQLKKVAIADYLPSLLFAPLLTWWLW